MSSESIYSNTILLIQVDAGGNILERIGGATITTSGTVIVDHTTTHDGYGSIRNTASGSTTAIGHILVSKSLNLSGDFTIEGWCMRLNKADGMTWLSASTTVATWQIQNWGSTTHPSFDLSGLVVATSSIENPANTWIHYALVRSGSTVKMYLNGVEACSSTSSDDLSCSGLMIGNGPNETNVESPCCWENIRISNVARYTSNFTPPGRFLSKAAYTEAAAEQIARGRSTLQLVETIKLTNSAVGSIYYVNAPKSLTAYLEDGTTSVTYTPLNFKADKPSYSSTEVPQFSMSMDGIDGDFQDFANAANASGLSTYCKLRLYNAADLTAPLQTEPLTFTVGQLDMTSLQAKIKAVFLNLTNKKGPLMRYTRAQFPALS